MIRQTVVEFRSIRRSSSIASIVSILFKNASTGGVRECLMLVKNPRRHAERFLNSWRLSHGKWRANICFTKRMLSRNPLRSNFVKLICSKLSIITCPSFHASSKYRPRRITIRLYLLLCGSSKKITENCKSKNLILAHLWHFLKKDGYYWHFLKKEGY